MDPRQRCQGGCTCRDGTKRRSSRGQNQQCAGVAQLAEQLICNQQVAGSSPIVSIHIAETLIVSDVQWNGGMPERPKGADCKSAGISLRWFEPISLHLMKRPAKAGPRE